MNKRKKFKTVAGYLRSMSDDLWQQQAMAALNGKTGISDDDGYRQIINNLLPQIGVAGSIGPTEKPQDGIERLRAAATGDAQIKALNACAKWLVRSKWRPSSWVVTTTPTSQAGMIYRGKVYTQQETEALERIQRERGVSLDEAIEITKTMEVSP